ncbi:hypothetical protein ABZ807_14400 [Micromonospora sp. NPDC047548]|uniref:hypothetical protein n=1 Tax=Micromonospora sp. NPDC047548 TaxID=3155624 RepID=UPI003406ACDA
MAPPSKIVSEQEVLAWFVEGRTYRWMSGEYLRKYDIVMTGSSWSYFREKHGITRRLVRTTISFRGR